MTEDQMEIIQEPGRVSDLFRLYEVIKDLEQNEQEIIATQRKAIDNIITESKNEAKHV